MKWFRICASN